MARRYNDDAQLAETAGNIANAMIEHRKNNEVAQEHIEMQAPIYF